MPPTFQDPIVLKSIIASQKKLKNKFQEKNLEGTVFLDNFVKDKERELATQSKLSEKSQLDFNGEKVANPLIQNQDNALASNEKLKEISDRVRQLIDTPTQGDQKIMIAIAKLKASNSNVVDAIDKLSKATKNAGLKAVLEDIKEVAITAEELHPEDEEAKDDFLGEEMDKILGDLTKASEVDDSKIVSLDLFKTAEDEKTRTRFQSEPNLSDGEWFKNLRINPEAFFGKENLKITKLKQNSNGSTSIKTIFELTEPLNTAQKGLLYHTEATLKENGLVNYGIDNIRRVLDIYQNVFEQGKPSSQPKGKINFLKAFISEKIGSGVSKSKKKKP